MYVPFFKIIKYFQSINCLWKVPFYRISQNNKKKLRENQRKICFFFSTYIEKKKKKKKYVGTLPVYLVIRVIFYSFLKHACSLKKDEEEEGKRIKCGDVLGKLILQRKKMRPLYIYISRIQLVIPICLPDENSGDVDQHTDVELPEC